MTGFKVMVTINQHAGIYTLHVSQKLPLTLDMAWDFFSSPSNLEKITPSHMQFHITSGQVDQMYPGQIITYKVSPLPGVRSNWVTEITQVEPKKYFVDEQRYGPYSMWHHEHHFRQVEDGVLMTDKVSYKIPFGFFGHLAQRLFVRKQLIAIFEYREKVLRERFN